MIITEYINNLNSVTLFVTIPFSNLHHEQLNHPYNSRNRIQIVVVGQ